MVTRTVSPLTAAFFASIYFFTVFVLDCTIIRVDAMAAMTVPKNIVVVGGGIQGTSVDSFHAFSTAGRENVFPYEISHPTYLVFFFLPSFCNRYKCCVSYRKESTSVPKIINDDYIVGSKSTSIGSVRERRGFHGKIMVSE